jgi:DNA-binding LacI/PurR family transcriptional regulator
MTEHWETVNHKTPRDRVSVGYVASMSNEPRVGRPSVTMADVARAAGVSRQLVSLVVRDTGYVAPQKRAVVLEAARRLGYRRNDLAASLAGRRTHSVGLAVLDIHNQVYADFADGVTSVLEPAGYQLLLAVGATPREQGIAGLESLLGLRMDGVLLATHIDASADLSSLLAGTPAVVMGESRGLARIDSVHGDDRMGMRLATEHLLVQGHRDVLFIGGPPSSQSEARAVGYRAAMEAAGLAARELEGDASEVGGASALLSALRAGARPSAVVCYNDATAIGVLACARREKLHVPSDLAVVGYDNTRASGYPGVDLTSVDQHAAKIGARAAEILLQRIEEPDKHAVDDVLTPRLIVRESSSRYLGSREFPVHVPTPS